MDIKTAILGFLGWKPLSGYELKKYLSQPDFIPWSGNNNQVYTALLALEKEGCVTGQTVFCGQSSAKKVYTITDAGKRRLKEGVMSEAEPPQYVNDFLLHIAWAEQLTGDEVAEMIDRYQKKVDAGLQMAQEAARRCEIFPARGAREERIWDMIYQSRAALYRNELNWLTKLRNALADKERTNDI